MSKADIQAEIAIVKILAGMFMDLIDWDDETVQMTIHRNAEMGSEGGWSLDDRCIDIRLYSYLINNLGYFQLLLLLNEKIRDVYEEVVSVEISLDNKDEAFVKKIRNEMNADKEHPVHGVYAIDLSKYSEENFEWIRRRIIKSMAELAAISDEFDKMVEDALLSLSAEDKAKITFCATNFMFLIRAFSKNDIFTRYIRSAVEDVKDLCGKFSR